MSLRRKNPEADARQERRAAVFVRHTPFSSLLAVAWIVIPFFGTVLYVIGWLSNNLRPTIMACVMFVFSVLAVSSVFIGWKVTGRVPLVFWHVAGTVFLSGAALVFFTAFGWSPTWLVIYYIFSGGVATSWMLYRLDALRADPKGDGEDSTGLAKLIGTRAKVRKVQDTGVAITAEIEPALGETRKDVNRALEKIEAAHPDSLPGQTTVLWSPDKHSGKLLIPHTDPLNPWPKWSGPSNFGAGFDAGFVEGLYFDGTLERGWYCAAFDDESVMIRPATHYGSMGVTRSGKSGTAAVRVVDGVLTRRGVVLGYVDMAKPEQSIAGDLLDDLVFYCDTPAKVRAMFGALFTLLRDRSIRMGKAGHRDWTMATYEELGIPALVVLCDEVQLILHTEMFLQVAQVCLSVGIFFDVLVPRADANSMPTTLRYTIPPWHCFGTGDAYSEAFALSEETRDAGATTINWGASMPGYHFFDLVPGVDKRYYPLRARSFNAPFGKLTEAAKAGRAFRASLPDEDVAALGKALETCHPRNAVTRQRAKTDLRKGKPMDDEPHRSNGAKPTGGEGGAESEDDTSTYVVADVIDDEGFEVPGMQDAEPGEMEAIRGVDIRKPIPPVTDDDGIELDDGVPPARTREQAREELHRALRQLAEEGFTTFHNRDLLDRCGRWSDSAMSIELGKLADGELVNPPGLSLTRVKWGTWGLWETVDAAA